MIDFKGVFPPVVTPFTVNGAFDTKALKFNLEKYVETDLAGILVSGSFGEGAYLTQAEKVAVMKTARTVIPEDKLMIASTGTETTAGTIELTRIAADLGADSALVITPHFYDGLMDQATLIRHFTAVADASAIPILLYNVPLYTHLNMTVETILSLSSHDNIAGMKESSGDVVKIASILKSAPAFQVLTGSGSAFLGALTIGAIGGIMGIANLAPNEMVQMMNLTARGDIEAAAAIQRSMLAPNKAITTGYGVAGAKAAMDMLGYRGGHVRAPLVDLDSGSKDKLRAILQEADLLI